MAKENQDDNKITYIDENGNEVLCDVLFTFHSDEFNKDYVLFYPEGEEDEDGKINVMAASYTESAENDKEGELFEVTTDAEWELIEKVLTDFENDSLEFENEEKAEEDK